MLSKPPLNPARVRRITGSFSWLDHRLIHQGFLARLSPAALLLYFFLVLVGDKNGVSFYHYDKICHLLKLELDQYLRARDELIRLDLIAFEHSYFVYYIYQSKVKLLKIMIQYLIQMMAAYKN